MTYAFQNLGIQCVKKKEITESLEVRKKIKVDPFKQGFDHAKSTSIDLNMVRLCFQVFLKQNKMLVPLEPVVSDVVKDRKTYSDIQIVDLSDDSSPVEGGKKILIFCEKVTKDDIEVHFLQTDMNGRQVVAKGEFTPVGVHKQFGISLKTPPYPNKDIYQPARCSLYLYKPKSGEKSDPKDFYYYPKSMKQEKPMSPALAEMLPPATGGNNMKRGRAPKQTNNPEELSSGQIIVPAKCSPAQLRGGGGGVTVVSPSKPAGAEPLQHLTEYLESQSLTNDILVSQPAQTFQQMSGESRFRTFLPALATFLYGI